MNSVPFVPGVGGKPSEADRESYRQRASNFDGLEFHNLEKVRFLEKVEDTDTNRLSVNKVQPDFELIEKTPEFVKNGDKKLFNVTWFGHSTLLFQIHGMNILFDPVFTKRISPVSWAGPQKFAVKNFDVEKLPQIDVLILTHDHYDHLDYNAIKKLDKKVRKYVVPLGVECHLKKWKISEEKITNMAWWEEIQVDGLLIGAVPAQHFSGRWISGRNQTLWNAYVLKDEYRTIFESGDTGYGKHFKLIHDKYGDMDAVFMECGQYNVRWPDIHSFPEQTVEEALELGAKVAMPVHWGSIVLSTNGWDDSVLRFVKAAKERGLNIMTPYLCETAWPEKFSEYQEEWWK